MASLGFEAKMTVNDLPLDIIGDIAIETSYTEVEVKNRTSIDTKTLRGMRTRTIDITVENNPEDAALSALKAAEKSGEDVKIGIKETEDALEADSFSEQMVITKFSKQYPLDDKKVVDVSLRISANKKAATP